MHERLARWPAAALVDALRGRTVVDAYSDGEGMDDVYLRLDDGTRIWLDVDVEDVTVDVPDGAPLELGPRGRLLVAVDRPTRSATALPADPPAACHAA